MLQPKRYINFRRLFMLQNARKPNTHCNFMTNKSFAAGLMLLLFLSVSACRMSETSPDDFLKENVEWLAADERQGRLAGTIQEAETANFIADKFLQFGLIPAGDDLTYLQHFTLTGPVTQAMNMENHISRNVVGFVEGTEHPGQYIILGAHYDSQGLGGVISMNENTEPAIHNGADDNASGTAGLLYLAKKISENRPEKSVLFVAFSGEEMGLIGSRFFTDNMDISRDSVLAMINLDMIGRLNNMKLTIFGTGTAGEWDEILDAVSEDSLEITRTPSGSGASDHAAFYESGIPVLHYFTGTHEDYHRESDSAGKINYAGMLRVLNHVEQVIFELGQYRPEMIGFTETRGSGRGTIQSDGVTLGVMPDYSFSGDGFRVEGVRPGQPADEAGMTEGDIIIQMDGKPVTDIYDYMDLLGNYRAGDEVTLVVRRHNEEIELQVTF